MQIQNKRYILSIAYNDYQNGIGGVDRAVIAQKEKLYQNQISYLFVFPQLARIKRCCVLAHLWEVIADDKNLGLYTTRELLDALWKLQKNGYQLQSITIHHLLNVYFSDLYLLLDHITGKIWVVIHDYYTVCPQCFLLKNGESFCGEDGYQREKCRDCKEGLAAEAHAKRMREFFACYLERIEFIFPSEYTKWLWSKAYPEVKAVKRVISHLELSGVYSGNMEGIEEGTSLKVGYLGQQLYLKGWDVWKRLYSEKKLADGYCSYYIGMGKEKGYADRYVKVSFQKEGRDVMLEKLRSLGLDCAVLWSICPETYSYVYFECLAANVFILTNADSGNIAAMVQRNGNGKVLNTVEELERLIGNPIVLKGEINRWRAERKLGAKVLSDNKVLFEIEYPKARILERFDGIAESKAEKEYKKMLVKMVKQLKKIFIKWFY